MAGLVVFSTSLGGCASNEIVKTVPTVEGERWLRFELGEDGKAHCYFTEKKKEEDANCFKHGNLLTTQEFIRLTSDP